MGCISTVLVSLLLSGAMMAGAGVDASDHTAVLTRLAFGSCANRRLPAASQRIFSTIAAQKPQVFLFLGDTVYNDVKTAPLPGWFRANTIENMRREYQARKMQPDYLALREQVPVLAVWDDHDYGLNDAGGDLPFKEESRKLFLDFVDEPKDSARWTRAGIYTAYRFGQDARTSVKVILLDLRFNRFPDDVLGEEQWQWLERELKSDEAVKFVCSSLQVLPLDRGLQEKFGQPWRSYERLAGLISKSRGVILLSGDVHHSSFLRSECGLSYPVTEFTSSGLTHSWMDTPILRAFEPLLHNVGRSRFEIDRAFTNRSFGLIDIDWIKRKVDLKVLDADGNQQRSQVVDIDSLVPTSEPSWKGCAYGSAMYTARWMPLMLVGTALASLFGVALGIYQYRACRNAARTQKPKAF